MPVALHRSKSHHRHGMVLRLRSGEMYFNPISVSADGHTSKTTSLCLVVTNCDHSMTCCHNPPTAGCGQLPCEVTFPSGSGLVEAGTMARGWRVSDETEFEVVVHERRGPLAEQLAVTSPILTTTSEEGVWLFPSAAPSGARYDEHVPCFHSNESPNTSTADESPTHFVNILEAHSQITRTTTPLGGVSSHIALAGCANGIICPRLSKFTTTVLLSSRFVHVRIVGGATLGQINL